MNTKKAKNNEDIFQVLRKIEKQPETTQRKLANDLNFSLGKLNYSLKELKKKGLVKIHNFYDNKNKLNYLYILTPKGLIEKTRLSIDFMTKKMNEYDELKKEFNQIKKDDSFKKYFKN
jgi:EPS-associated MarR family transcriptional regulator